MSIPPYAEEHMRSDHVRLKPRKLSKLIPGKYLSPEEEFFCPSCGKENAPPEHNIPGGCGCGLHWFCLGNSLQLWR